MVTNLMCPFGASHICDGGLIVGKAAARAQCSARASAASALTGAW